MDKQQVIQSILAAVITLFVFYIGLYAAYLPMENAIIEIQGICNNMTPETYNITKNHEACKFNETTGKYDLNITILNEVWT